MDNKSKSEIETASDNRNYRHVTLDHPIKRGDKQISDITLRKPFGPALRGLSLAKLVNEADYDSYEKLIPRISEPVISLDDIKSGNLDPSDLLQLMGEITDFFIPSKVRANMPDQTEAQTH